MDVLLAIEPTAWQRMLAAPAASRVVAPDPMRVGDTAGSILVLPIHGVMHFRLGWLAAFGGTDTASLASLIRGAAEDPGVAELVLDLHSPGGDVAGTEELAAVVAEARARKPVTAVVNAMAASAAYWVAAAATRIVSTPSGLAGGLGVYGTHVDLSELERKAGITVSLISAPEGKTDGNEHTPLSERGRAAMQATVDAFYALFVARVAAGRGVPADVVRGARFGQGRVFAAKEAQQRGLVDAIGTLPEVVASAARRVGAADVEFRQRRLRAHALAAGGPAGQHVADKVTERLQRARRMGAQELLARRRRAASLGVRL
jgi:signal peptide peptidase SppA